MVLSKVILTVYIIRRNLLIGYLINILCYIPYTTVVNLYHHSAN